MTSAQSSTVISLAALPSLMISRTVLATISSAKPRKMRRVRFGSLMRKVLRVSGAG